MDKKMSETILSYSLKGTPIPECESSREKGIDNTTGAALSLVL